jgi:hypothetical protein
LRSQVCRLQSQGEPQSILLTADSIAEPDPKDCTAPRPIVESHAAFGHWISFTLCLVLAVAFTLPTSLSPASGLLGQSGDNFQHAWFLWHFARSIVEFQNPFYTNLIYYPSTVNLAWSTTDPLAAIIALPASLLLGPVVAYNLSLILQLALAAFFARLLCLRACRNEAAALIGGICFGFSPFLLAHALGHLSLVTAFPIPLYFLALDRVLRNRGPSGKKDWKEGWKDGLLLGLALLLVSLAHYNYTVLCLVATVVVIGVETVLTGPRLLEKIWRPLGWAATTFLITFSPLLMMLIGNAADKPSPRPFGHIQEFSADALGFLVPSWNHLLFGNFAHDLDPSIFAAGYEGTVYVGPVILALAIVGFSKARDRERRWVVQAGVLSAIFYLFSLGPALRIFGRQTRIPGPATLLYRIPWTRFISAPARFHVIAALGLAILASLGVAYLLDRLHTKWQRCALVAGVTAVLLLDLLTVPFPVSSTIDPAWVGDSGLAPRACTVPSSLQKGTVVTFPLIVRPYSMKSMWMQVTDRGRYALVDGYLSYTADRVWSDYYRNPVLRSLLSVQGVFHTPVDPRADRDAARAAFRDLNASAFVVFDSPQRDGALRYLSALLAEPGQSAGSCTVFAVPPEVSADASAHYSR